MCPFKRKDNRFYAVLAKLIEQFHGYIVDNFPQKELFCLILHQNYDNWYFRYFKTFRQIHE